MDPVLKSKIIAELVKRMNREPKENEIINAQNDYLIMTEVRLKDLELRIDALEKSKI